MYYKAFTPNENGTSQIITQGKPVKGQWVYGAYAKTYDKNQTAHHVIIACDDESKTSQTYPVLSASVARATGLKDKNSREIFEHDRCLLFGKLSTNTMGTIVWGDGSFLFVEDKTKLTEELRTILKLGYQMAILGNDGS